MRYGATETKLCKISIYWKKSKEREKALQSQISHTERDTGFIMKAGLKAENELEVDC